MRSKFVKGAAPPAALLLAGCAGPIQPVPSDAPSSRPCNGELNSDQLRRSNANGGRHSAIRFSRSWLNRRWPTTTMLPSLPHAYVKHGRRKKLRGCSDTPPLVSASTPGRRGQSAPPARQSRRRRRNRSSRLPMNSICSAALAVRFASLNRVRPQLGST
jgi:hypothetical protein